MLYLFEISKKWPFRKGVSFGGVGGHIFPHRTRTFWRFGVFSKNLVWSGVVCIQGFTVLGPVLQYDKILLPSASPPRRESTPSNTHTK